LIQLKNQLIGGAFGIFEFAAGSAPFFAAVVFDFGGADAGGWPLLGGLPVGGPLGLPIEL